MKEEESPGPLVRFFGNTAVARVMDFLTIFKKFDYSLTDIAKNSGVGRMTLFRILPQLERYGVIKMTRRVGRAKLYRLNIESSVSKFVDKLAFEIASIDAQQIAEEEISKQSLKVPAIEA